ncbi:class I SAM-dependent rRNA methyltransferase [Paenibacillus ginsengarvi]|uniref:Class I SAM-dependent rRNA methyltransferase n=1 Tax=Paenibacillus ginsengarvi TaxID=400777 RepID=A0A3B0CXA2_9BACL|nr:class I SAM-dependent rRNA methyltransferase [Paenibacillus ginsengarvi]RKN86979.1 class I SAM-dependent rRNA methyltransferase [Paenibacillus ginsengarvi]
MASVILDRKRKKRLEQGQPWIYANEIASVDGEYEPGDLVSVLSHTGQYLATGYINPKSQIAVRVVSYTPLEQMDRDFFASRFEQCAQLRSRFVGEATGYRLVYGEADFLPGLVVDRFADVLVIQVLSLGMERCKPLIVETLAELFQPRGIYERSDVSVRELEGLEQIKGPLYGDCPRYVEIVENGLRIEVDIEQGQKTGYFLDQRENRASIHKLMTGWGARSGIRLATDESTGRSVPVNANGKEVTFPYWDGASVLECFSHTGSFTLNACSGGAKKVTCLDISEHAVDTARRNVERNGFTDRVEFVVADAFDYLRAQVRGLEERRARAQAGQGSGAGKVDTSKPVGAEGRTWDVVILDPPAFAKTKGAVPGALRGYKDINLHAMKLVNEGGYLVTASCSYHVRPDVFLETILSAASDARKVLRQIEYRGAGKDHPQLLGTSEGDYLKFAIFEVRSR